MGAVLPPDRLTPAAHPSWKREQVINIWISLGFKEMYVMYICYILSTFMEASFWSSGLKYTGTGKFILFSSCPPFTTCRDVNRKKSLIFHPNSVKESQAVQKTDVLDLLWGGHQFESVIWVRISNNSWSLLKDQRTKSDFLQYQSGCLYIDGYLANR